MLEIAKNWIGLLRHSKKGNQNQIIMAVIIAAAIIIAVVIFTSNQTHPFWEVR